MKIVIDIPENVYKYLKQEWVKVPEDDSVINQIMYGILYGIVLPKGHGDLIDRSKLAYYRCPNNVKDCPPSYDFTCNSCDYGITHKFRVDTAEVIIPADKENKE